MIKTFFSHYDHPTIVIEPKKTGKADGITTEGKSVKFYGHYCNVDDVKDKDVFETLINGKSFGVDYFLTGDLNCPKKIVIHPQDASVGKMPGDAAHDAQVSEQKSKDAATEKRINAIEAKLDGVMDVLEKIAGKLEPDSKQPAEEVAGASEEKKKPGRPAKQ